MQGSKSNTLPNELLTWTICKKCTSFPTQPFSHTHAHTHKYTHTNTNITAISSIFSTLKMQFDIQPSQKTNMSCFYDNVTNCFYNKNVQSFGEKKIKYMILTILLNKTLIPDNKTGNLEPRTFPATAAYKEMWMLYLNCMNDATVHRKKQDLNRMGRKNEQRKKISNSTSFTRKTAFTSSTPASLSFLLRRRRKKSRGMNS